MEFITLQTYTFPQEMSVVRSLLESEGIKTFVKNEILSQVNPFYTNVGGGIQLQVMAEDSHRALEIMLNHGLIHPNDILAPKNKVPFQHLTSKIPFLKRFEPFYRLMMLLTLLLIPLVIIIYMIFKP